MKNPRARTLLLLTAALIGCSDTAAITAPAADPAPAFDPTARFSIADGADGGNSRFYFLPPLVSSWNVSPENDPSVLPALRVEVCALATASSCVAGAPVASYGPAANTTWHSNGDDFDWDNILGIRVVLNQYLAFWPTTRSTNAAVDYRVTVLANGVALGHVDLDVISDSRNYHSRPGYLPVTAGSVVPILFRIKRGLVKTVTLTPAAATVAPGQTVTVQAAAVDYQGTAATGRTAVWVSGDTTIATVSATGVVKGMRVGTAVITAWVDGVPGTMTVTVRSPVTSIVLAPSPLLTIAKSATAALTLSAFDAGGAAVTTGVVAQWTTSDSSRVRVVTTATSPLVATITGVSPGQATITVAVPGTALTKTVVVTVAAPPVSVVGGEPSTLDAAALLGPGVPLTALAWQSSNPAIVTVSASGVVTPVGIGTAAVSVVATLPSGATVSGTIQITATLPVWCTIRPDIAVGPTAFQVLTAGGLSVQLSAVAPPSFPAGTTLAWSSGVADPVNPPFALSATGLVTPLHGGFGSVNVAVPGTAVFGTGCVVVIGAPVAPAPIPAGIRFRSVPTSLLITPAGVKQSAAVTAEVYDNAGNAIAGSFNYRWSVGNPAVLAPASGGGATATVTALAAGSSSLTATVSLPSGDLATSATITVIDQTPPPAGPSGVTITSSSTTALHPGDTAQLTAVVSGAQPNASDIVWTSTSPSFLEIVGPNTGSTITVHVLSAPRATSIQVNAHVVSNQQAADGSIAIPIAP
jgi:hypothetical protein